MRIKLNLPLAAQLSIFLRQIISVGKEVCTQSLVLQLLPNKRTLHQQRYSLSQSHTSKIIGFTLQNIFGTLTTQPPRQGTIAEKVTFSHINAPA